MKALPDNRGEEKETVACPAYIYMCIHRKIMEKRKGVKQRKEERKEGRQGEVKERKGGRGYGKEKKEMVSDDSLRISFFKLHLSEDITLETFHYNC